jgi:integrase
MKAWLEASGITTGPIFRPVNKSDKLSADRLKPHSVAVPVKQRAALVGIDAEKVSGHSLRSGYVTSAMEHNVNPVTMSEHTRHRDLSMILTYSRRANRYVNHSGKAFL